jgi:hypothetical protein
VQPNRIRETAGIELTSERGAIGVGGRERDGDQPKTNCPRCSPAGGRAALSAALLGRVARRLPAAAASCGLGTWDGLARVCFAPCFFVFVSGLGSPCFLFSFFLFEGFFSAVESDLIAQECPEDKRSPAERKICSASAKRAFGFPACLFSPLIAILATSKHAGILY